ncbi:acyl-CoA N-acyltransferase [Jaminaea rosea]|uniref:Histone acetyltransferase type B catalytic subunit n=1 Tax=Jaminaea rosea TaxID=1569628 RepID=A0A316UM75_9BASI|nr:acyl-CoA N-acyltransferase [Jaminaea rosea]PWN25918.1 acyl-CoA N-acyltransferase [Jaminaea rosea]
MADIWAADANKALSIRLVGAPSPADKPFSPEFTYQVGFGQEETIFGYTNLSILLTFSASSLLPLLSVNFSTVNEATTAKIDDIPAILSEFLPPDHTIDAEEHAKKLEEDIKGWKPLGDKVGEYSRPGGASKGKGKAGSKRPAPGTSANGAASSSSSSSAGAAAGDSDALHFEIYRSNWQTPGWRDFHRRMQIFALFFIEGASYIHEDEGNWEWLTTWQRWVDDEGRTRWAFVGYTSLYRFWHYPSSARLRLSQFIILPPYHKQGHGSRLYAHVYAQAQADEAVTELTIEDPNEAFDQLRDTCDLKTLLQPGGIVAQMKEEQPERGGIGAPLGKARSERWRLKAKIAKRQWSRLIEMLQLMELDPSDRAAIKAYRLQVKARLYRFNKDVLTDLPLSERHQKLQETYENLLEAEYGELVGVDVEPFLDGPDSSSSDGMGNGVKRFKGDDDE